MGRKKILLICLLLAAGLAVLCYPMVSSAVNRLSGSYAIQEWEQQVDAMEEDDREAQRKLALAYNDALLEGEAADNYRDVLNLGNGMMGYIRIPKIEVNLPIYHGVEENVLAKGVGHLPESGFPIGREGDHAVLTGHTGLPSAKLFTDLIKLQEGDRFFVCTLQEELCYQVDQIRVVLPTEGQDLAAVPGKDYCTLVTCTPYGINSHRLLVRGVRVNLDMTEPSEAPEEESRPEGTRWLWLLLLFPLILTLWSAKRLLDGYRKPPYNGKYLRKEL